MNRLAIRTAIARWWPLFMLFIVYALHTMDRMIFNILMSAIGHEFSLNDSQLGLLVGLGYAVPFALMGLPMGMLADHISRKRLLAGLLMTWSSFTGISGLVTSFGSLLAARMAVGAAESGTPSTALSLLSDFFPPRIRAVATGIFYAGAPVGALIGFYLGATVAASSGWRMALLVAAVPGFVIALLFLCTVREPTREKVATSVFPSVADIRMLLQNRRLKFLICAIVIASMVAIGISAWIPTILQRNHALSLRQVGLWSSLIVGVSGLAGSLLGAVLSRTYADGRDDRLLKIAGGAMLVVSLTAVVAMFNETNIFLILMMCWGTAICVYFGPAFGLCLNIAPPHLRGSLIAVLLVLSNIIGGGVGPQLVGLVSDYFHHNGDALALPHALAVLAGFGFVSAALFYAAIGSNNGQPNDITESVR